jgi:hypothetical protein
MAEEIEEKLGNLGEDELVNESQVVKGLEIDNSMSNQRQYGEAKLSTKEEQEAASKNLSAYEQRKKD